MKPIKKQIFAEIVDNETTQSGIIIVGESSVKRNIAKVIAIGSQVENVKVGDTIDYNKFEATEYTHEGKKCIFVKEVGTLFIH
ncbi:co-chaperonin GroES [Cellulophaga phage phi13:2]|uniref:Chaperonin cpn10 n=1 Tax=Cellulophaga phage phi13:2 TaxID=1328030 RepID=S0A283_9CAUD|nr:co-chaperonin GroES [Cellulophaga phage phi13:2]AGO49689.1 chaperonin cpn10 [Cellulophaga phage phi13:2]